MMLLHMTTVLMVRIKLNQKQDSESCSMKITDDKLLGHIRAILKPNMKHKWTKGGKVPKAERKDILTMIRERQGKTVPKGVDESPIQKTLTQKQWTRFAKIYVEEVGDSKVDETTGLSHKEVLDWVGKSQELFEEYDNTPSEDYSKLKRFLAGLSLSPVNKNHFDKLFDE